jgi:hypothetical protein
MPRLPLDPPVDDELRDVVAAASNNRQPDALLAVARSAATSRGAVSEAPFDVPTAAEAA